MRSRCAAATVAAATILGAVSLTAASSADATSTTILQGTVVDSGQTVSSAKVTLVAWPNVDYLNAMAAGATVPLRTVQTTYSASDGTFSLSPDLSTIPVMYHEPDGAVNFDMVVVEPSGTSGLTNTTVLSAASPTSSAATNPDVATTSEPTIETVDMSTVQPDSAGVGCGPYYATGTWHRALPQKFMRVFALTTGKARVIETISSSQSLGIGLKSGSDNWKMSGTADLETESSAMGTIVYDNNYLIYNRVNYRDFEQDCNFGYTSYQRRPTGFSALQDQGLATAVSPPLGWTSGTTSCQTVRRNADGTATTWKKANGTNRKFTAGIDIGPISVEAQAAYSTNTEEEWTVTHVELLCPNSGSNYGWPNSPEAAMLPVPSSCTSSPCPTITRNRR